VELQGDLNMLPVGAGLTEHYSPHMVFKRLGMRYVNARVVYIAAHGARIRKAVTYPAGKNGWMSDHGALQASVTAHRKGHHG
jgi:hypothetical protein